MSGRIRLVFRLFSGVALLTAAVPASAQRVSPARSGFSSVSSGSYGKAATAVHIAVLGAVSESGVYRFRKAPLLFEVLQQAGGLTPSATGNIHIVRGNQGFLQTHITTGGRMTLTDGDVVLVSGKRSNRTGQRGRFSTGRSPLSPNRPAEVALLNLLDRPVVLRLRPQHASLKTLLTLLRQPADIASTIHVISPSHRSASARRRQSTTRLTQPADDILADGTVLIFDRRFVQPRAIPPLPQPSDARRAVSPSSAIRQTKAGAQDLLVVPRQALPEGVSTGKVSAGNHSGNQDEHQTGGQRQTAGYRGEETGKIDNGESTQKQIDKERQRVQQLLQSARQDIAAGRLKEARAKALAARNSPVDFRLWEDRPGLLLAEIDRLELEREKRTSPLIASGPAPEERPLRGALRMYPPSMSPPAGPAAGSGRRNVPRPQGTESVFSPARPVPDPVEPDEFPPAGSSSPRQNGTDNAAAEGKKMQTAGTIPDRNTTGPAAPNDTEDIADKADDEERTGEKRGRLDPLTLVIGIFAGLGVLSAAGFLWSMGRKAGRASATVLQPRRWIADCLERLIRDELDVCEEPLTVTGPLEFFGRTTGAVQSRIDEGHLPAAGVPPHFVPGPLQKPASVSAAEINQTATPAAASSAAAVPDTPASPAAGTSAANHTGGPHHPGLRGSNAGPAAERASRPAGAERKAPPKVSSGVLQEALSRVHSEESR